MARAPADGWAAGLQCTGTTQMAWLTVDLLPPNTCARMICRVQGSGGGASTSLSAAAAGGIAAAVATAVLAALALIMYPAWRRRGLGRRVSSNWRVLEAPSASPDTVLLVTDIVSCLLSGKADSRAAQWFACIGRGRLLAAQGMAVHAYQTVES